MEYTLSFCRSVVRLFFSPVSWFCACIAIRRSWADLCGRSADFMPYWAVLTGQSSQLRCCHLSMASSWGSGISLLAIAVAVMLLISRTIKIHRFTDSQSAHSGTHGRKIASRQHKRFIRPMYKTHPSVGWWYIVITFSYKASCFSSTTMGQNTAAVVRMPNWGYSRAPLLQSQARLYDQEASRPHWLMIHLKESSFMVQHSTLEFKLWSGSHKTSSFTCTTPFFQLWWRKGFRKLQCKFHQKKGCSGKGNYSRLHDHKQLHQFILQTECLHHA